MSSAPKGFLLTRPGNGGRVRGRAASWAGAFRPATVHRALASALLAADGQRVDRTRLDGALLFVEDRLRRAPAVIGAGSRAAAVAFAVVLVITTRMPPDRAAPDCVAAIANRIERAGLPGLSEYVRMVRSLALVGWYDAPPTAVHAD
jgi:hypothetical protein